MRLGGLIHFDEAPQLSVCVLPIEKSQIQTKHKNQFSQTEAVRKKNVVKLKVCLVRRCSPPRECKSWRNIFENYSSKDLRNMYIPLSSLKDLRNRARMW